LILICDLGLSLKKQFIFLEKTTNKNDFLADNSLITPIGEGFNMARVLLSFGEDHTLLGFSGGIVGENIRYILNDSLINLNLIPIKEKSSEQVNLDFLDNKINIRDRQPKISREEVANFYTEYKEGLNLSEVICLVGEHPFNIPEDMAYNIVDLSIKWGRQILLAVKDKSFQNAIEASPYVLMISKSILEDITNLSLDFETEIIKACRYLFDKGIKHIIIDNNEKGLIILNEEYGYRVSVPFKYGKGELSYGGLLGGLALAMSRNYDMETVCKLSYACGLVNFEDKNLELEVTDIKALMKEIELARFNNI